MRFGNVKLQWKFLVHTNVHQTDMSNFMPIRPQSYVEILWRDLI